MVAFLALLTVASQSVLSLGFAQRSEQSQVARRLASSVVHQAIAEFVVNPAFNNDLRLQTEDGWAALTFRRDHPEGLPFSTNNWEGDSPLGYGRGVPVGMVHLVLTSQVKNARHRCEVILDLPVYPMAVACSGPVTIDQATVAAVPDELLEQDLDQILSSRLLPGNLGNNHPRSRDSVLLTRDSRVTGFVQSRGGITNRGAEVGGELRPLWPEALELPRLSSSMLDPRRALQEEEEVLYSVLPAQSYSDLTVSSHCVIPGSLRVDGVLTLNQGLLFIDGDLTVRGGIQGEGAIGVRGRVEVSGSSHLRASSRVAILADGDLRLLGENRSQHRFEGLIYGQGAIHIEKITLLGACIQNAPEGSPANLVGVTIDNANVLWANTTTSMAFAPPIDLLIATLLNAPLELDAVKLSEESQEPDRFVGKTPIRGPLARGPGELKRLANDWRPNDVGVLRVAFNARGLPRFGYFWWGRSPGSNLPLRKPDGSPAIQGIYYPSVEALIHGRGLGLAGPEEAVMARLEDREHEPAPGGIDNLPSVIVNGIFHDGGYREFGRDGADGIQEEPLRQRLGQSLHSVLLAVDASRKRKAGQFNHFSLDPSRFLNRSRAVRIRFWREF